MPVLVFVGYRLDAECFAKLVKDVVIRVHVNIYLRDTDTIVLDSPYNENEVRDTKRIAGARWDKLKRVWTFPITSYNEVVNLAEAYKLSIDPQLKSLRVSHPVGPERIEVAKDKFWVHFPYDGVKITAIRKVPGAVFDNGRWGVPFSSVVEIRKFLTNFNIPIAAPDFEKMSEIEAKVTAESTARRELSAAEDYSLDVPNFHGELLPFQKAGVAYAVRARRTFIADEMGLGKTIQAIAAIEKADAFPAVVSCPPSLTLNWAKEITRFVPHRTVGLVRGRSDFPEGEFDYTIIGDANLAHWEKSLKGYQSYVFDESHRYKNPKTQRTKAALGVARGAKGLVLNLTGTPITNRPAEYASQLEILGHIKEFGGKWGFYKRYAGAYQDEFGQWDISGASNLEELNHRLRGLCYVRRTKEQVLKELAPERQETLYVEGEKIAMKEYREAEDDIIEYVALRAAEIARELGESPYSAAVRARIRAESAEQLVRLNVLRRLAAMTKIPAAHEWIEERVESGLKVVVAAHHREVVDAIASKWGNIKIMGGMDVYQVEMNKDKFQNQDAQVMVLSIEAASMGHTLTASQDIAIVELPWTPSAVKQVISRLHRHGQEGSVLAITMLAANTIDERLYHLLQEKAKVVDAATEGKKVEDMSLLGDLVLSFLK